VFIDTKCAVKIGECDCDVGIFFACSRNLALKTIVTRNYRRLSSGDTHYMRNV